MSWLDRWSPWRLRAKLALFEIVPNRFEGITVVSTEKYEALEASKAQLRADLRLADENKDHARKERDEARNALGKQEVLARVEVGIAKSLEAENCALRARLDDVLTAASYKVADEYNPTPPAEPEPKRMVGVDFADGPDEPALVYVEFDGDKPPLTPLTASEDYRPEPDWQEAADAMPPCPKCGLAEHVEKSGLGELGTHYCNSLICPPSGYFTPPTEASDD